MHLKKIDNISWEVYRNETNIGYLTKVFDIWVGHNLNGEAIVHSYEQLTCILFLVDHLEKEHNKVKDNREREERNKVREILKGKEKDKEDLNELINSLQQLLTSSV